MWSAERDRAMETCANLNEGKEGHQTAYNEARCQGMLEDVVLFRPDDVLSWLGHAILFLLLTNPTYLKRRKWSGKEHEERRRLSTLADMPLHEVSFHEVVEAAFLLEGEDVIAPVDSDLPDLLAPTPTWPPVATPATPVPSRAPSPLPDNEGTGTTDSTSVVLNSTPQLLPRADSADTPTIDEGPTTTPPNTPTIASRTSSEAPQATVPAPVVNATLPDCSWPGLATTRAPCPPSPPPPPPPTPELEDASDSPPANAWAEPRSLERRGVASKSATDEADGPWGPARRLERSHMPQSAGSLALAHVQPHPLRHRCASIPSHMFQDSLDDVGHQRSPSNASIDSTGSSAGDTNDTNDNTADASDQAAEECSCGAPARPASCPLSESSLQALAPKEAWGEPRPWNWGQDAAVEPAASHDAPTAAKRSELEPAQPRFSEEASEVGKEDAGGAALAAPAAPPTLEETLTGEVRDFVQLVDLLGEETADARQFVLGQLKALVHCVFDGGRIAEYGSTKSGLALPDSDLDVCIVINRKPGPYSLDRVMMLQHLHIVAEHLRAMDWVSHLQLVPASMPVLKFWAKGCVPVDVTCLGKAHNGLRCQRFVAEQVTERALVRPLVLTVKQLVRQCGVGDTLAGGLSSHAVVLMVLSFLNWHRASCPGRQLPPGAPATPSPRPPSRSNRGRGGHGNSAWSSATAGDCACGEGHLLLAFLEHHAQLDYRTTGISVHRGYFNRKAGPRSGALVADLHIDDLFFKKVNVAQGMYRMSQLKAVFADALRVLRQGAGLSAVLGTTSEHQPDAVRVLDAWPALGHAPRHHR